MKWLLKYLKLKNHHYVTVPALLCFLQFIISVIEIVKSGVFDRTALNQLISSADGFGTIVLFAIMLIFKKRK